MRSVLRRMSTAAAEVAPNADIIILISADDSQSVS